MKKTFLFIVLASVVCTWFYISKTIPVKIITGCYKSKFDTICIRENYEYIQHENGNITAIGKWEKYQYKDNGTNYTALVLYEFDSTRSHVFNEYDIFPVGSLLLGEFFTLGKEKVMYIKSE
ncbi:hypothetical protein [Thalassomonas sp. M1454]|uniref:hypothetical protein n=1 Tax=Thalassomonas sp. M1454 TaxID=2594477 RepID=UPI0011816C01|nr:hypothetical protein [Thalassomonas sp. M1454]TRX53445.1 hypothetical protein FNN08_14320 [Thalassomonas sp. M1454]